VISWKNLREISSLRLANEFKSAANNIDGYGIHDSLKSSYRTNIAKFINMIIARFRESRSDQRK